MDLYEFIRNHTKRHVNFDDVHGPQCTDLVRLYIEEVLGFDQLPLVEIAPQIWYKVDESLYEKIPLPGNIAEFGDIGIWDWRYGGTGHIAIAVCGDSKRAVFFSQNDPGGTPPELKLYGYDFMLGLLRPRR
jgi:hypothetical protein